MNIHNFLILCFLNSSQRCVPHALPYQHKDVSCNTLPYVLRLDSWKLLYHSLSTPGSPHISDCRSPPSTWPATPARPCSRPICLRGRCPRFGHSPNPRASRCQRRHHTSSSDGRHRHRSLRQSSWPASRRDHKGRKGCHHTLAAAISGHEIIDCASYALV